LVTTDIKQCAQRQRGNALDSSLEFQLWHMQKAKRQNKQPQRARLRLPAPPARERP
jgi:hypothetical protein